MTGDIIVVIDGDDITHPQRFERIAQIFAEHPHADALYHDYVRFEAGAPDFTEAAAQRTSKYVERAVDFGALRPYRAGLFESTGRFRAFLAANGTGMTQGSLALRRRMIEKAGPTVFRPDLPTFQDVELYLRLSRNGVFLYLDEVLFAYRRTPGSNLQTVIERSHVERIFQVKAPVLLKVEGELPDTDLQEVREALAEGWRSMGWRASRAGCLEIAMTCYKHFVRMTRRPRNFVDGIYEMMRLYQRRHFIQDS